MQHQTKIIVTADQTELFYQSWHPSPDSKAAIALVHGIKEHSDRYVHLVEAFVARGYEIHAIDLHGHGRSGGQQGHLDSWAEMDACVTALFQEMRQHSGSKPFLVYGHSLGGMIALDYCLRHPEGVAGVIASAPSVGAVGVSPVLIMIGRLMNRVWPSFSISMKASFEEGAISRDFEELARGELDPLCFEKISARFGMTILERAEWTRQNAHRWQIPLLIIHGTGDKITDPEGSRQFVQRIPYADVQLNEYEGGYHELHNDICREQVLADMADWLDARV